ncbi:FAD-binding, type 2 [Cordyceps fumosorosea ARSEF 2679]|uniref:FAD-binding, type 2 n=1 Tax=Cordyceps fumosorosea (strain ARSEF 2679) TaxID=1081104 RepID=A0A167Q5K6_CORFA|nr:FAD-binding, type 2 [Cordyceps fumosorosea ARSEF 2679]OAA57315.1 FAD-binding, type 2 [Cordyceps fumosorosea ARSEF 2679]
MFRSAVSLCLLALAPSALSLPQQHPSNRTAPPSCRYLPQDREWPSPASWSRLNTTVQGRLIPGEPLAHVCHGADYDEVACADLAGRWTEQAPYFSDPVSVMSPFWANNSCTPFTGPSAPCLLGNYASYAINVSGAADVVAGLQFAKERNVRVQVKNTGHDYLGRSTGQGSLALWTHNLKSISFLNYTSARYTGPAVKLGAGVQAFEAYPAAAARGLRVVGGYCPTVGIAGGYFQGAGHGPLLGTYGLAADNTLEVEVVTVDGKHLVASPTRNADLFWALNGGGGGTYGVVLSVTTRAHRDGPVAGASLTVSAGNDTEAFWGVVAAWHRHLLRLDALPGFTSVYHISDAVFQLSQVTYADRGADDVRAALDPFLKEVATLGFNYTLETNAQPSYLAHYERYNPKLPYGSYFNNETIGGRLVSRDAVRRNLPQVVAAIRGIASAARGTFVNGVAGNANRGRAPGETVNAVLPAWRDALYHLIIEEVYPGDAPTGRLVAAQADMNAHQELLRTATPAGSGAYINEATFDNPQWKEDYFGANYDKLLRVKKRYDAQGVLYGPASVGSDAWVRRSDGRLCRK